MKSKSSLCTSIRGSIYVVYVGFKTATCIHKLFICGFGFA